MCFAEPGVLAGVGRRLVVTEHVVLVLNYRGGGRAVAESQYISIAASKSGVAHRRQISRRFIIQ